MIYFLYGKDTERARLKFDGLIGGLLKKKQNATLFRLNDLSWDEDYLNELVGGQGLFEKRYIVALNNTFLNKEAKEYILDCLEEMADSENIFIFLEEDIDKNTLEKIEKFAEKVQEFMLKTKEEKTFFNIFAITDALGERDRKKTWVLYQKALADGLVAEEVFWRIVWQVRAMLASSGSSNANEAGQKPFVYSKSSRAAKNYSKEELTELSSDLTKLYHDSRRGITEFDIGLERLVLSI